MPGTPASTLRRTSSAGTPEITWKGLSVSAGRHQGRKRAPVCWDEPPDDDTPRRVRGQPQRRHRVRQRRSGRTVAAGYADHRTPGDAGCVTRTSARSADALGSYIPDWVDRGIARGAARGSGRRRCCRRRLRGRDADLGRRRNRSGRPFYEHRHLASIAESPSNRVERPADYCGEV